MSLHRKNDSEGKWKPDNSPYICRMFFQYLKLSVRDTVICYGADSAEYSVRAVFSPVPVQAVPLQKHFV